MQDTCEMRHQRKSLVGGTTANHEDERYKVPIQSCTCCFHYWSNWNWQRARKANSNSTLKNLGYFLSLPLSTYCKCSTTFALLAKAVLRLVKPLRQGSLRLLWTPVSSLCNARSLNPVVFGNLMETLKN